jgi:hypothetical protein
MEQFLEQVQQAETKFNRETETDTEVALATRPSGR